MGANPAIGTVGALEQVEEDRVEVLVLERVREVVAALKDVSILCVGVALVLANNAGTPLRGGCVRRLQVGGLLTGRVVALLDLESQKVYTATLLRTYLI